MHKVAQRCIDRALARTSFSGSTGFPYDGDGDMVVGAVIAPEVIVHLTATYIHIDYDAALLVVQSSKARKYGDLVPGQSYSLRMFNNYVLPRIASGVCVQSE